MIGSNTGNFIACSISSGKSSRRLCRLYFSTQTVPQQFLLLRYHTPAFEAIKSDENVSTCAELSGREEHQPKRFSPPQIQKQGSIENPENWPTSTGSAFSATPPMTCFSYHGLPQVKAGNSGQQKCA